METQTIFIIASVFIAVAIIIFFVQQMLTKIYHTQKTDEDQNKLLKEWVMQMLEETRQSRKEMQDRLDHTNRGINERLDNAAKVISGVSKSMYDVNKAIGEMSEIGRHMQGLQEFLRSPKLRGNLGEQIMKDMLSQSLPHGQFSLQHAFSNSTIVDAIVKTDHGIIPIDSKFPMENFKNMVGCENEQDKDNFRKAFINDVRKHIRAIASKYILTDQGTVDFALMYVPSESVAYEIIVNTPEIIDYAHEQRVIIVSPNQFNHYLKVIMIGMEGKKIEEQAQFIMRSLRGIQQDTKRFGEEFRVMVSHLNNAKTKADSAQNAFAQLSNKIDTVQTLGEQVDTLSIDNTAQDSSTLL